MSNGQDTSKLYVILNMVKAWQEKNNFMYSVNTEIQISDTCLIEELWRLKVVHHWQEYIKLIVFVFVIWI